MLVQCNEGRDCGDIAALVIPGGPTADAVVGHSVSTLKSELHPQLLASASPAAWYSRQKRTSRHAAHVPL